MSSPGSFEPRGPAERGLNERRGMGRTAPLIAIAEKFADELKAELA